MLLLCYCFIQSLLTGRQKSLLENYKSKVFADRQADIQASFQTRLMEAKDEVCHFNTLVHHIQLNLVGSRLKNFNKLSCNHVTSFLATVLPVLYCKGFVYFDAMYKYFY